MSIHFAIFVGAEMKAVLVSYLFPASLFFFQFLKQIEVEGGRGGGGARSWRGQQLPLNFYCR